MYRARQPLCRCYVSALMFVVGCGGKVSVHELPPIPVADLGGQLERPGSRLKPLVWLSNDGPADRTERFYDTMLDLECAFSLADDGTYRCLPVASAIAAAEHEGDDTRLFADAACQEQLHLYAADPDAISPGKLRRFAATEAEQGCDSGTRIYELGPQYEGTKYMLQQGLGCVPAAGENRILAAQPGAMQEQQIYRRGARIGNDDFVRAEPSVQSAGDGSLVFYQLNAEDGAAVVLGFYDLDKRTRCQDRLLGTVRFCSPAKTGYSVPLASPGDWPHSLSVNEIPCDSLLAESDRCSRARHTHVAGESTYREVTALARIGAPPETLADCVKAVEPYRRGSLYAIGDEVPVSVFPAIYDEYDQLGSLGRAISRSENGELRLPRGAGQFIWGDDPSAVCRLRVAADGQVRCLPGDLRPTTEFTDESWTVAVAASSIASPFGAVVLAYDDSGRTHVSEMNGTYYGATYRRDVDGVCSGGYSGSGTLAGAELSPELFPRYELAWGE